MNFDNIAWGRRMRLVRRVPCANNCPSALGLSSIIFVIISVYIKNHLLIFILCTSVFSAFGTIYTLRSRPAKNPSRPPNLFGSSGR